MDFLMKQEDWRHVKYFSPNENWGDWTKLHKLLIFGLDALREYVDKPIIVHCAYATSGHSSKSYHYKGMAADIHIKGLPVLDQFLAAERFDVFNGIGIYPMWSHPGLHVDVRPRTERISKDSRWMAIYKNGKQVYISLNRTNIRRYC